MPIARYFRQSIPMIVLLMMPGCSKGPAPGPEVTPHPPGVPHASFEPREIDLGHIATHSSKEVETSVRIINKGNANLKLGTISTSCGCTLVKRPKGLISPAGEELIAINVKSGVESGPRSSVVTLTTNDPAMPVIELPIRWFVEMPAMFEPRSVDFGKVRRADRLHRRVIITLKGDIRFASLRAVSNIPDVQCAFSASDEGNQTRDLAIELSAGSTTGPNHATVRLYQGETDLHAILPIHWDVESTFTATPAAIFTGRAKPGNVLERQITVTSAVNHHYEIEDVSIDKKEYSESIKIEKIGDSKQLITIRLKVPESKGPHRFLISIKVQSDDSSRLIVPWSLVVP